MSPHQNEISQPGMSPANAVALPALSSTFDDSLAETLSAYQQKAAERPTVTIDR